MLKRWTVVFYLILSTLFLQLSADFFTEAAALYWQAEQAGLGYAIKLSPSKRAQVKTPSFDWDVGFKAGVGYKVPHDTWDLLLQFTSLQTHTDAKVEADEKGTLSPTWLFSADPVAPFVDQSTMHWRLHLGVLDALLRKMCDFSSSLSFRPEIGIRTAWIRQKFNVGYFGGNRFPDQETEMRTKNKFWGIGPHIGARTQWKYRYGLSLFSDIAWSILYGQFYLHQDEDLVSSGEKTLGIHNVYRQSASIGQLALGLLWERSFKGALKRLQLGFVWDASLFFSQNQLIRFVDRPSSNQFISNQGDLSVMGGEFSLCFSF